MKLVIVAGLLVSVALVVGVWWTRDVHASVPARLYDTTLYPNGGEKTNWNAYKGKVLLIVNVASKCGYTSQYAGLESLYRTYKDKGLVVMGFPSNDFLMQEPGTDEEIATFCRTQYDVTFPMFKKSRVRGKEANPVFVYLTNKEKNPDFAGNITWNFNKFLINRQGQVVARFGSGVTPSDEALIRAIDQALAAK